MVGSLDETHNNLILFNKKCKLDPDYKFAFFSECRLDTYSAYFLTNCDIFDRLKQGYIMNPIDKLTTAEKEEYYQLRCLDEEHKLRLDVFEDKYDYAGCSYCCNEFFE